MTPPLSPSAEHARLLRKLDTIADLSLEEKRAVAALPLDLRIVEEGADMVREGDQPSHSCMIAEGLACRYKVLGEGQRQIMSFHMAGDMPDLQSLHLRPMDHSVGAVTRCVVGYIPHAAILDLTRRQPGVGAALWRDTLIDAAVFREWLAGVGRRSAHARIAHLVCELFVRMRALGLADDGSFELPITQVEVADSLGLSAVHVNRVLQDLRGAGLMANRGRKLVIVDWPGLQRAGEFDAGYLHLRRAAA